MHIDPFGVELWMNEFELLCKYNLAETCCDSITIAELLMLSQQKQDSLNELLSMKMTYGAIEGSDRLRSAIANLYTHQAPSNVLVTHGTIGANSLVYQTLLSEGDNVISMVPSYQQHYAIPASVGATVQKLQLSAKNQFLPDLDHLSKLATANTKLITLTNPNNPTGSLIDQSMLNEIAAIARKSNAWILCDEVYRGIDQMDPGTTSSMADLYEKGISTASVSKVFSLAGLRLGWISAPSDVIDAVMIHRDYNTISVGMINDHIASIALENHQSILERNKALTRNNLAILSDWVEAEPLISWVKPRSGTVALLKYELDIPSRAFCVNLLNETGVLLTPGSAMDMEGYVRIGFANATDVLESGLPLLSEYLAKIAQSSSN
ncbi:MAG: aminotransferase [Gammaproteobacteria bacterium]|nr:aminotransferase [Gammaproteobacteria bacterium]